MFLGNNILELYLQLIFPVKVWHLVRHRPTYLKTKRWSSQSPHPSGKCQSPHPSGKHQHPSGKCQSPHPSGKWRPQPWGNHQPQNQPRFQWSPLPNGLTIILHWPPWMTEVGQPIWSTSSGPLRNPPSNQPNQNFCSNLRTKLQRKTIWHSHKNTTAILQRCWKHNANLRWGMARS